jgi:hypothetical protein
LQLLLAERLERVLCCESFEDTIVHKPIKVPGVSTIRPHGSITPRAPRRYRRYLLFSLVVNDAAIEHDVALWTVDGVPVRMFYAGRRWRVSDMPTRLRESVWGAPLQGTHNLYGWRFQATDDAGEAFVFDVYRDLDGWHVHRSYA